MRGVKVPSPLPSSRLPVGTRSLLYGAHQFVLHPVLVALAWTKLYGFPLDPRLHLAFFVHDLGYAGCRDIDGPEGERHVEFGARVMWRLCDRREYHAHQLIARHHAQDTRTLPAHALGTWGKLTLYHSRFTARAHNQPHSRLCVADKYATVLDPAWLFLPRVVLSGEIWEFLSLATGPSKYQGEPTVPGTQTLDLSAEEVQQRRLTRRTWKAMRVWKRNLDLYLRAWVQEHKDGRSDHWTPAGPRDRAA